MWGFLARFCAIQHSTANHSTILFVVCRVTLGVACLPFLHTHGEIVIHYYHNRGLGVFGRSKSFWSLWYLKLKQREICVLCVFCVLSDGMDFHSSKGALKKNAQSSSKLRITLVRCDGKIGRRVTTDWDCCMLITNRCEIEETWQTVAF